MATQTRLRERYESDVRKSLIEKFGYSNVHQVPKLEKVVINMSVGDAIANAQDPRCRGQGVGDDQRPETGHHQGQEVDRRVQAARRYDDRLQGYPARRADVRLPRQAVQYRACRASATSAGFRASRSTAAATTTWDCESSSSSRRSISTRSTKRAGWTSSSSPPPRTDEEATEFLTQMGLPLQKRTGPRWLRPRRSRSPSARRNLRCAQHNRCLACGRPRGYYRKFGHVPDLLPRKRASRVRARRDESELVDDGRRHRSDRRHADAHSQREYGQSRDRRHSGLADEARHRGNPQRGRLHHGATSWSARDRKARYASRSSTARKKKKSSPDCAASAGPGCASTRRRPRSRACWAASVS